MGLFLSAFAILLRIAGLGWAAHIGIGSILFFLPIQIYYLYFDIDTCDASLMQKAILRSPVVLFPLIFLFQPDFDDSGETLVMCELLIGNETRPILENWSWILAILTAIFYMLPVLYTRKYISSKHPTQSN